LQQQVVAAATSCHQFLPIARRPLASTCSIIEYKSPNNSTCMNSVFVSYNHAHGHKACEFGCAINANINTETAWQQLACYM